MHTTSIKYFAIALALGISGALHASFLMQDKAVVISVPVADCIGMSAQKIDPSCTTDSFYDQLPFSPEKGPYSCPRIHQCLFNEMGIICEEKGDELLIEFPHFYCIVDNKPNSRFWLKKSSVRALINQEHTTVLPEPLTYQDPNDNKLVLTITLPWQDPRSQIWYSAGTRFKRNPDEDTDTSWSIYVFDYKTDSVHTSDVDQFCARIAQPTSLSEAKQFFVSLLRSWIEDAEDSLAYVWGGCSYIERYSDEFDCEKHMRGDTQLLSWQRPCKPGTHCGFDCSGLVLRAAQIAGIHYFCKNTTTIGHTLDDIPQDKDLEEGDLILIKGHVMVISDLTDNTLIDAYSYRSGYGCLREVPLFDAFEGVHTYADLRKLVKSNLPIKLKDIHGVAVKTVPSVRLLRLAHTD